MHRDDSNRHSLAPALIAWGLFACAAVALRGVRWDEDYEFAQVLLGHIAYPAGHVLPRYVSSLYSLQPWSLAAWMALFPDTLSPNALRNVLFVLSTVLPPFLLARTLTGRNVWGVATALFCLAGIHVAFYSSYPVQVWPDLYSNGHLGTAWVLIAVWAFLDGRSRTAWFMTGLAPAIHLGQAPPLFVLAGLLLLRHALHRERGPLVQACVWGGVGLGISLVTAVWIGSGALPDPVSDGYTDPIAATEVYRGYMAHWATHRGIPWGTGHLAVLGALVLALLGSLPGAKHSGQVRVLLVYLCAVAALVYGIMAVHLLMGPSIPRVLIAWMPYRLMNHAAPILLALAVAALVRSLRGWGMALVVAALGGLALRPAAALCLPAPFFARYLANGEALSFALFGAAATLCVMEVSPRLRWWCIALLAGLFVWLLSFHVFGATCVALGGGTALFLARRGELDWPKMPAAAWAAALLLTLVLLGGQYAMRSPLPRSAFESEAAAYLATQTMEHKLVLAHYQQEGLQARLNQPMVADMATMTWIPYKPSLGPALYRLYRDCFGVNFAPGDGETISDGAWDERWAAMTPAAWQALGQRYGIGYVLAPRDVGVQLPEVVAGDRMALYRIP